METTGDPYIDKLDFNSKIYKRLKLSHYSILRSFENIFGLKILIFFFHIVAYTDHSNSTFYYCDGTGLGVGVGMGLTWGEVLGKNGSYDDVK